MRAIFSTALIGALVWIFSKLINKSVKDAEKIAKKHEENLRKQQVSDLKATRLRKNPDTGIYEPSDD